jgi:hypothetical protein
MIEDGLEENEMELELVGITELIADHLAGETPERGSNSSIRYSAGFPVC